MRHGRMMVSPFTFYRGAAKIMAADLNGHAASRPHGAALRGRSPVELRHVRIAGAGAAVRRERLRRNASRAVRIRRQAHGRELHDRGAEQRVLEGGHPGGTLASVRAYREAMAGFAQMGTMDVWYAHLSEQELMAAIKNLAHTKAAEARRRQSKEGQEGREGRPGDHGQGTHARQPAGAVQARRDGRRPIPDHQPATDRDPAPGARPPPRRCRQTSSEHVIHEQFRAYRATLRERPASSAGAIRDHRRRAQGRRGRERRNARVHRPAPGSRPAGSALPPGQGGDDLGARGPPSEESVQATR